METTRQNHLYTTTTTTNGHYERNNNYNSSSSSLNQSRSKDGGGGGNSSAVMARAREYNRMIEDQNQNTNVKKKTTIPYQQEEEEEEEEDHAVVTPELLVDALSGHEDGLLAIAERLMEHYDEGYDAMGEAIIDAFADVQKLFQHVVEAAHMEGAAYEAERKEEELQKFKQQHGLLSDNNNHHHHDRGTNHTTTGTNTTAMNHTTTTTNNSSSYRNSSRNNNASPTPPHRHEEFIDEDVRELLQQALNQSINIQKKEQLMDIYENACNSASALLPVDSDHRGRLQLSISRSEGMSPDRACTILKYAMEDVLRSHAPRDNIPESQRGDCVLEKTVTPSLNNLVEEMKDILSAPVYQDSPIQSVAPQFFSELDVMQKKHQSMEERLEHKLASLKAEFLLAREEWEEKNNAIALENQQYKLKYDRLLQQRSDHQSSPSNHSSSSNPIHTTNNLKNSILPTFSETETECESPRKSVASVASLGSTLGQRIFSCGTNVSSTSDSRRTPSLVSSHVSRKGGGMNLSNYMS